MPENRTLLQTQQNLVADLVTAAGLARASFRWFPHTTEYYVVSRLEHRPSRFFYLFDYRTNEYGGEQPYAIYSPGKDSRQGEEWLNEWDEHEVHVSNWLENLRRELEAPDLWSASAALAANAADIGQNEPFTATEREFIAGELRSIRERIDETYELTSAQGELVDLRLNYLAAAASRVGRFDWKGLVVSVLYNMTWDLAFNPAQAKQLADFFVSAFARLFQVLPQLPS